MNKFKVKIIYKILVSHEEIVEAESCSEAKIKLFNSKFQLSNEELQKAFDKKDFHDSYCDVV